MMSHVIHDPFLLFTVDFEERKHLCKNGTGGYTLLVCFDTVCIHGSSCVILTCTATSYPTGLQQQQHYQRCRPCLTILTRIKDMLFLLQATGAAATPPPPTTTTPNPNPNDNYPSSLNALFIVLSCYMTVLKKDPSKPLTEQEVNISEWRW